MLNSHIKSRYADYLDALNSGTPRIRLPDHQHDPSKSVGRIHASSLARCPLAEAMKRRGAAKLIEQTPDQRLNLYHLFQQSTRDAEVLQEAILWAGTGQVEVSIDSEELRLRGRIDMLVDYEGEKHIVEIKRREGFGVKGTQPPNPYLSDCYQTLAYGLVTGIRSMSILLLIRNSNNLESNPAAFMLWTFQPFEDGFVLVNEKGERWNSKYNQPKYLSFEAVRAEIERHRAYLDGELNAPPLPDFLNEEAGKDCFSWERGELPVKYKDKYKGKTERRENAIPKCPFWCHSDDLTPIEVFETGYQSGIYKFDEAAPF